MRLLPLPFPRDLTVDFFQKHALVLRQFAQSSTSDTRYTVPWGIAAVAIELMILLWTPLCNAYTSFPDSAR